MKKIFILVLIVALIGVGVYVIIRGQSPEETPSLPGVIEGDREEETAEDVTSDSETATEEAPTGDDTVTKPGESTTTLGSSVEGRPLTAYHFGTGDKELLFIGGIHGGYSWNTALVAYELIEYLESNPSVVPDSLTVTVVPVLNPDGLFKVVGTTEPFSASSVPDNASLKTAGRFNAHTVDLNRNFDCEWSSEGVWQSKKVSGGSKAFSEPESAALKAYVESRDLVGVVAWYSAAGGVFASSCRNGILPGTQAMTDTYAKASGYKAYQEFDFYSITGDMVNWFAKNSVPAISVLLTNHTDIEWDKNKKGIDALLESYR